MPDVVTSCIRTKVPQGRTEASFTDKNSELLRYSLHKPQINLFLAARLSSTFEVMPKAACQTTRDGAAVTTAVSALLNNIRPNSSGIHTQDWPVTTAANTAFAPALQWSPRAETGTERKRKRFTKKLHHASRGGTPPTFGLSLCIYSSVSWSTHLSSA